MLVLLCGACGSEIDAGEEKALLERLDQMQRRLEAMQRQIEELEGNATPQDAEVSHTIPIELPLPAARDAATGVATFEVRIDGSKTFVNGKLVDDAQLEATLVELAREYPEASLVVNAAADTPHERVVAVMDKARQLGIKRLAVAARSPEPIPER